MISELIHIIFWIGAISSLFLIVLILLSILGGNIDLDLDTDTDVDVDGDIDGGLGIVKSAMTFIGMSCLTMYALYSTTTLTDIWLIMVSIIVGVISIMLLSTFLKWLLTQQETGNWYLHDALNETGEVYITIPQYGTGKVLIKINGIEREINAKSLDNITINAREKVVITEVAKDHVIVMKYS